MVLVDPRESLRSLAVVNVQVEENVPDVATSLHVPIPQLYTARCGTAAYGVDLFASLVKHRGEHLVTLGARLGELVLVHLLVLDAYCAAATPNTTTTTTNTNTTTRSRPDSYPLLDLTLQFFHRAGGSTLAVEINSSVRDNCTSLLSLYSL